MDSDVDIVKNGVLPVIGEHKSVRSLALYMNLVMAPTIHPELTTLVIIVSLGCVILIH